MPSTNPHAVNHIASASKSPTVEQRITDPTRQRRMRIVERDDVGTRPLGKTGVGLRERLSATPT